VQQASRVPRSPCRRVHAHADPGGAGCLARGGVTRSGVRIHPGKPFRVPRVFLEGGGHDRFEGPDESRQPAANSVSIRLSRKNLQKVVCGYRVRLGPQGPAGQYVSLHGR